MTDERFEKMQSEVRELQDKMLRTQHQSILRDLELMQSVKRHQQELEDLTGHMTTLATTVTLAVDRMERAEKRTDERWNQLIELLARQHSNGGGN